MKKEIGKWFMDIAKYVATAVLISSFFGGFEKREAVYVVGTIIVIIGLLVGLLFIHDKNSNATVILS
jgi:hypothetical protein